MAKSTSLSTWTDDEVEVLLKVTDEHKVSKRLRVLLGNRSRGNIVIFWIALEKKGKYDVM